MLIFIAGGGTGGHIYPGLVIAKALRDRGDKILWLGTIKGLENELVTAQGFNLERLPSRGWGKGLCNIATLWELGKGILKAMKLIKKYKPSVLVGLGGYPSAPGVIAAGFSNLPVLLLEQNYYPGKANLWLARWANKVGVSFPESRKYFKASKALLTGNPVRPEVIERTREKAYANLGLNSSKLTIMISGASQGAKSINAAVMEALPGWKDKNFRVFHLIGKSEFSTIKSQAEQLLAGGTLEYFPFDYVDCVEDLYAASDLAVSRAGATTLAELTVRGLPAILVPYPYAGAHQEGNAQWLVDKGGALMVEDYKIKEVLKNLAVELLSDKARLEKMSVGCKSAGNTKAVQTILTLVDSIKKGEFKDEKI
jgi:UDP-N-acetylglucosamine--N-acetylmuramyl-(pentapeptide) pyrophosphoryl-undecaprenol N-acetylglucosamine transferase